MKIASWILIGLAILLFTLGSTASMVIAYMASPSLDAITPSATLDTLGLDSEVATAFRARRGTAAALGLSWAILLLCIILGPYRKGQVWAWWAILCSVAAFAGSTALRIPTLGTSQGVSTAVILLVVVVVGLLLDVRRLSQKGV